MNPIQALISDADGTLVNTLYLIRHGQYEAAKAYLENHGIPQHDIPDYDTYSAILNQVVGGATRDTTEATIRLLYADSPSYIESINFDELYTGLAPIQDHIAPEYVTAYDGLTKLLTTIGSKNIALAIFSSGSKHHIVRNFGIALPELHMKDFYRDESVSDDEKLRQFEQKCMGHFGISNLTIITAEDTNRHKPYPDSLLLAMKRLGISPASATVVGDHNFDMQAAIAAGVGQRIGITHGFSEESILRDAGATDIVHSLADLQMLIETH